MLERLNEVDTMLEAVLRETLDQGTPTDRDDPAAYWTERAAVASLASAVALVSIAKTLAERGD